MAYIVALAMGLICLGVRFNQQTVFEVSFIIFSAIGFMFRFNPMWQPATQGATPLLSFHQVVSPSFQSAGALNSKAPSAPGIPLLTAEGGSIVATGQYDYWQTKNEY